MRRLLLLSCAAAAAALAGCGTANPCETRVDYQNAAQTRPIAVPEGYDQLPPEARVDIPPSSTPPDVDQRCLEKPPRFFDEQAEDDDAD